MGRLLNYALLIKLGFKVKDGRIINPSSVFYSNRDTYYDMLSRGDTLKDEDVLAWCEYFLNGLKNEMEKIDSLLDFQYVKNKIIIPALHNALDREHITERENKILEILISNEDMTIKSEELDRLGIVNSTTKSKIMAALRDKNIIRPIKEGGRIYTINFVNNYLLRGIIKTLNDEGFVADFLNKPFKNNF